MRLSSQSDKRHNPNPDPDLNPDPDPDPNPDPNPKIGLKVRGKSKTISVQNAASENVRNKVLWSWRLSNVNCVNHVSSAFDYSDGQTALSSEITASDMNWIDDDFHKASLCFNIGEIKSLRSRMRPSLDCKV